MADEAGDIWEVDLAARVRDLPSIQVLAKVPTPIVVRAEELCDALDDAGEARPDRLLLVAALVYAAQPNVDDLMAKLKAYRLANVHEVILEKTKTEGRIRLKKPPRAA